MYLRVYDNLLSPEKCKELIEHFKKQELTVIKNGVADYSRGIMINSELAKEIFEKVKNDLPKSLNILYANDHFRFSSYTPNQEFKIHKDGINQDYKGNRSIITINIFLNDEFTGGTTDFYHTFNKDSLKTSVKPKIGRAAIFYSQQYHSGTVVTSGNKYLLRTDLMH